MGRVARYKKIKAFDPYSKENGRRVQLDTVGIWGLGDTGRKPKKRSKTSEKLRARRGKKRKVGEHEKEKAGFFDAPPENGDDFDLVGSLTKQAPIPKEASISPAVHVSKLTSSTSTAVPPTSSAIAEDGELNATKLLNLEKQVEGKSTAVVFQGRMEGETKRAYNRRIQSETRQLITSQRGGPRNPEKKQKKKDFLSSKKKKKKGNNKGDVQGNLNDDDSEDNPKRDGVLVTAEQAYEARARETVVRFGEQAERPPSFRHLPRGAIRKGGQRTPTPLMSETAILAEQEAMEHIKRKTLAQYALLKMKRKQQGDFHL
jgi:hypothetical protein